MLNLGMESSRAAQFVTSIIEGAASLHNTILLIYHIYHVIQHRRIKHRTSKLEVLSIISMFFMVIFNILSTKVSSILHPIIGCQLFTNIAASEYLVSKITLYFLFLERLFSVFQNTHYSFKPKSIWTSRILLSLYLPSTVYLLFQTGHHCYNSEYNVCEPKWPMWTHALISFGDFFIGILISILFTRRLMMLGMSTKKRARNRLRSRSKTTQNKGSLGTKSRLSLPGLSKSNSRRTLSIDNIRVLKRHPTPNSLQDNGESEMEIDLTRIVIDAEGKVMDSSDYVITRKPSTPISVADAIMNDKLAWDALNKFTLLTVLSIFTTLFSLILSAIFEVASLWISMDTMVNCWCLLLIFGPHKKLYVSLCGNIQKVTISVKCLSYYSCHCCCCKIKPSKWNERDIKSTTKSTADLSVTSRSNTLNRCGSNRLMAMKLGIPSMSSASKLGTGHCYNEEETISSPISPSQMSTKSKSCPTMDEERNVNVNLEKIRRLAAAVSDNLPSPSAATMSYPTSTTTMNHNNSLRYIGSPSDLAPISEESNMMALARNSMGTMPDFSVLESMGSFGGHSMQPSLTLTHPETLVNNNEHEHDPNVSIIITPPIAFIPDDVDLYGGGGISDNDPQIDSDPEIEIVFEDGDGDGNLNLGVGITDDIEESIIIVTTEMLGDD